MREGDRELRELRQRREEDARLRTIVADLTLYRHILQQPLSKSLTPAELRERVDACRLFDIDRSTDRY